MIRKLPLLALLTVFVFGLPASAPADYAKLGKRCKRVVFTPQSDDVADNIFKREISCKRARRVVKIVRRKGDLTPLGFSCSYRSHDPNDGLAHTDFVCFNTGNRRVSWAQF
jgi:hypothetical protein